MNVRSCAGIKNHGSINGPVGLASTGLGIKSIGKWMEFLHSRLKIVEIVLRCLLVFVREGEKKEADAFDL